MSVVWVVQFKHHLSQTLLGNGATKQNKFLVVGGLLVLCLVE